MPTLAPDLETVRLGGKRALAAALARAEAAPHAPDVTALLDHAFQTPLARVIGLTGTPGVGKSTLTSGLVARWRALGLRVAVAAVDPSSRLTGGALLGDRTRIHTDPDDQNVFVRSFAARDRLGGLSHAAIGAVTLLAALYDRVIVESVGVGQSEADVAIIADTVLLLIQPGSGDALQFMKAGIMELPDVIAVTKADMGALATRARADVEGALSLASRADGKPAVQIVLVSARTGEGLADLDRALEQQGLPRALRSERARAIVMDAIATETGQRGVRRAIKDGIPKIDERPFAYIGSFVSK